MTGETNKIANIIIPTYNRSELLCNALDSVLNQTYRYINVLIVSDGHDSIVQGIVEDYNTRDTNIRFNYYEIAHEGNSGSKPRIYGIEQLDDKGCVCFLDDDNILYNTYIEKMIQATNQSDVVVCQILTKNEEDRIFPLSEEVINTVLTHNVLGHIDSLNFMVSNKIAKLCKDTWMNSSEIITHDFNFFKDCCNHSKYKFVEEVLAEHRRTNDWFIEPERKG